MEAVNLNPSTTPVQPVKSRGGTFIYMIVVIALLLSLIAAGYLFYKSQTQGVIDLSKYAGPSPGPTPGPTPDPSPGPTPDPSPDPTPGPSMPEEDDSIVNVEPLDENLGDTIVVTEEGSEYQNKDGSNTENYMIFPMNVPASVSENFVYAYNPNDTAVNATTLMGSNQTWVSQTNKCPDYTYNCLFYERVEDGRVKKITNNSGVDLLQQFTDDLYDGKLTVYTENSEQFANMYELDENGRLFLKKNGENVQMKPGVNVPPGMFFMALVLKYYSTGKPKPKIVIDLPNKTKSEIMATMNP